MDSAAHSTHVWRRTGGTLPTPMDPGFLPRRAVTGAMPADCGSASAEAERSRCAPKAPRRRGAQTAPAPGRAANTGAVGLALGALRNGVVEVGNRVQEDPELGDERLDQERMRGDNPLISRQWYRVLDGLDACVDDVGVTHVMGAEEAL